jgi:dihydrofolate reductase
VQTRKLILYIASSLDGYIAAPGDDLSFLDKVTLEGEDYGYGSFMETIDTIILGRKTYDWIIKNAPEYAHPDKNVYVISHNPNPNVGNTVFYTSDLRLLVQKLKSEEGKNIFCDGGAEVVNALLKLKLFDELIISIVPVLLGNGTRLFNDDYPFHNLELVTSTQFDTGLVQLHYKIVSFEA